MPHGDLFSRPLSLPWPSLGSPQSHSASVYVCRHAVSFPVTTLLVTQLGLEATGVKGKPGSEWKVRFTPHFNVYVVCKAAGHRTPKRLEPRDTLNPLTLLWKKQPQRDPMTPPKPFPTSQRIQGRTLGFLRPNLFPSPAALSFHSSSKPRLFKAQQTAKGCFSEMPGGIQEKSLAFPTPFFLRLHMSQCMYGDQGSPLTQGNKDACRKGRRLLF